MYINIIINNNNVIFLQLNTNRPRLCCIYDYDIANILFDSFKRFLLFWKGCFNNVIHGIGRGCIMSGSFWRKK